MRVVKCVLTAALVALLASAAQTQTRESTPKPPPPPCPTVMVSCPDLVGKETHLTYKANVTGGDPLVTPTFNWTVSAGTISSGQGTSSITVDTSSLPACPSMTATVDVRGYDRSCSTLASCSFFVCCLASPRKVDEYGDIRFNDEKARLDNFAAELQNDPTAQGYLVCYGRRRSRRDEARRRCERARDYVSLSFRQGDVRLVTVDGGFREEPAVELWLVPSGATPPKASPTVEPKDVGPPAAPRKARRRGRR